MVTRAVLQSPTRWARRGDLDAFVPASTRAGRRRTRRRIRRLDSTQHTHPQRRLLIDPAVLVDRAARYPEPPPHDAVLALLRLAPDGREQALEQARVVPGEFGDALRHALGSSTETVGRDMPLWIAAARARAPRADDEAVAKKHGRPWPDAARAAATTIEVVVSPGDLRYLAAREQNDSSREEPGTLPRPSPSGTSG